MLGLGGSARGQQPQMRGGSAPPQQPPNETFNRYRSYETVQTTVYLCSKSSSKSWIPCLVVDTHEILFDFEIPWGTLLYIRLDFSLSVANIIIAAFIHVWQFKTNYDLKMQFG